VDGTHLLGGIGIGAVLLLFVAQLSLQPLDFALELVALLFALGGLILQESPGILQLLVSGIDLCLCVVFVVIGQRRGYRKGGNFIKNLAYRLLEFILGHAFSTQSKKVGENSKKEVDLLEDRF